MMYTSPPFPCGCVVKVFYNSNKGQPIEDTMIVHCPKHTAADDLLEALEYLVNDMKGWVTHEREYLEEARKALAKAKGNTGKKD